MRVAIYILAALAAFSAVAIVAAKVILKKPWKETMSRLFEFFS